MNNIALKACVILLSSFCFLSCSISTQSFTKNTFAVEQKLADKPKDKPLAVMLENNTTMCYSPNGTKLSLQSCGKNTTPARYDVFSRVAWNINKQWLCMSLDDNSQNIILKPCVLNDPKQRFVLKDNAFFTPDLKLQVKHTPNYTLIAASANNKKALNHTLYTMQDWVDTIATPAGINISTFIGWNFTTPSGFDIYYLRNNESIKSSPTDFIYSPQTKQIAQFNPNDASFVCLHSTQSKNEEWNWVSYQKCDENSKNQKWDIFLFGDNSTAMLKDYNGNFLRLTKYGTHWGVPYTATSEYITKDTPNSPTSLFLFSHDVQDWQRFVNANLSDELKVCPAPGFTLEQNNRAFQDSKKAFDVRQKSLKNTKNSLKTPPLPPHFTLNDAWLKRLWQISTSTDGIRQRAGSCGVCLLHTYQIIAELVNYPLNPLDSGGYFFDTQFGINPFPSFRSRYPALTRQLEAVSVFSGIPTSWRDYERYVVQIDRSIALSMLPGYFWVASSFAYSGQQILDALDDLLRAPVGSIWIMYIDMFDPVSRQASAHSLPIIRLNDGILLLPTNLIPAPSYEEYRSTLRALFTARNRQEALSILVMQDLTNIRFLYTLQLREPYRNPLSQAISSNNCSGEGEERRGSRTSPLISTINQCASGRCLIQ